MLTVLKLDVLVPTNSLGSVREKVQDPEAERGCHSKGGELFNQSAGDDNVECRTVVHKQHSNIGVSVFKV